MNMIISLCILITTINFIHGNYLNHQCYICDEEVCENPTVNDIKNCSLDESGGISGKYFVSGAFLDNNNTNGIYNKIERELTAFSLGPLGLNVSVAPSWNSLTRWVCYVSKDKHRGCLIMGKGLCSEDKSWLGKLTSLAQKITNIMKKAKKIVNLMFNDATIAAKLDNTHKLNITNWFAENYMSKLVSNSKDSQYQLDYCCEGNKCNSVSMINISIVVMILSILILI